MFNSTETDGTGTNLSGYTGAIITKKIPRVSYKEGFLSIHHWINW